MPQKRKPPKRKRLPVTLSPDTDLWNYVKERAAEEDRTVTAIVERALRALYPDAPRKDGDV